MRYIGSKILLLDNIRELVERKAAGASSFCDIFSGTACVARYFKQWFQVYSNDLLYFSYCLQRGTVENDSVPEFDKLRSFLGGKDPIDYLNELPGSEKEKLPQEKRFFQNNFSPAGGRMYLRDDNALSIDFARNKIEEWQQAELIPEDEYFYLLAACVEGIPFVSNISGTYGAFHKQWDARTFKKYELQKLPVNSNGKLNKCFREDGVELAAKISGDILYIDPPYNERQYLPNYHLLETAARYDFPTLSGKTGTRFNDAKSDFCNRKKALLALERLIRNANYTHIILSYNSDGIMPVESIEAIMKQNAEPETFEIVQIPYRRYKSRGLTCGGELKEMLFYIRKNTHGFSR